jgi:hypothetical protein
MCDAYEKDEKFVNLVPLSAGTEIHNYEKDEKFVILVPLNYELCHLDF